MKKDNPCWFPLKKIVSHSSTDDILECGHSLVMASDIYGPRFPDKRRCHHCWNALTEEQREEVRRKSAERKEKRRKKEWEEWRKYNQKRNL